MKIQITDVAQPGCRMPVVNNPTVYMPDHGLLAAVNYCDAKKDTRVFLVDVQRLFSESYPVPDEQHGAYGFVRGADGNLYLGFFGGALYRFDMAAKSFSRLAQPFPDKLIWGGGASRAGRIYMGVYPTGEFCEYDIATDTCQVFAPMPVERLGFYARGFVELSDGRIFVYIDGARPTAVIYDPESRAIVATHQLGLEHGGANVCALDRDHVLISEKSSLKTLNIRTGTIDGVFLDGLPETLRFIRPGDNGFLAVGRGLYEFDTRGVRVLKEALRDNNLPAGGLHHVHDRVFICLGDNGLVTRFDADTGAEAHAQIANETDCGMKLQMIRKQPDAPVAVGSHFINSQIFRLDLATDQVTPSRHKIVTAGGQINCATFLHGTCYLGIYTQALIAAYRPDQPFACNENPRTIAKVGHGQNRPISIVNDGHLVYMATKASYRELGGAITVLDPATEAIEVYRDFVPTHSPTSLFWDGRHQLVGTTQTFGDQRTCAATDPHAVIFVWNTRERKTVLTAKPWENDALSALALSPAGVLIGFSDGKYYLFSTADGSCRVVDSPVSPPHGGIFLDAEHLLGCGREENGREDHFFVLNLSSNTVADCGPSRGSRLFERLSDTEILVDADGYRLQKLTLPAAPEY